MWASLTAAQNTTDAYAPYMVDCPANFTLTRKPDSISPRELCYVQQRKAKAAEPFVNYLARLNLADFDLATYAQLIKNDSTRLMPSLAYANSGGAWRSAFSGIGGLLALDSQTPGANEARIGGLYQSMTYISGLSGGSWPVLSTTVSDGVPIHQLVEDWMVNISRFSANNYSPYAVPYTALFEQIAGKAEAGFNVSVSDFLGRAFAYEFFPQNTTFSSVTGQSTFLNYEIPFPILVTAGMNTSTRTEDGLYYPTEHAAKVFPEPSFLTRANEGSVVRMDPIRIRFLGYWLHADQVRGYSPRNETVCREPGPSLASRSPTGRYIITNQPQALFLAQSQLLTTAGISPALQTTR